MLNSRDINRLRPDVAANFRIMKAKLEALGYPVGVFTVRDDEYQMDCFKRGTGGKPPATFHSVKAGLAFDVFKNVPGHAYDDPEFFRKAGEIGKMLGFTWGGGWSKFPDKPHFQWDAHGKYSGSNIVAGKMPPQMPLFKEEQDMTKEEVRAIAKEEAKAQTTIYRNLEDVPLWGKPTVEKLLKCKAITGDEKGIDLPYETLRLLVINDRMGLYGK